MRHNHFRHGLELMARDAQEEKTMQKLMIITAVVRVHPHHSQGWLRDEIQEKLADFAPVKHLTVEEYQDRDEG